MPKPKKPAAPTVTIDPVAAWKLKLKELSDPRVFEGWQDAPAAVKRHVLDKLSKAIGRTWPKEIIAALAREKRRNSTRTKRTS